MDSTMFGATFPGTLRPLSKLVTGKPLPCSSASAAHGPASVTGKQAACLQQPKFVVELDDAFLQLWPQRFDFLYAIHPDPDVKPDWRTESRYPLSDRAFHQGTYLYGVRFGTQTRYGVLDIDAGSPYHPSKDSFAIQRMMEALEPVGLVRHLAVQSSDSGGLHLYLPFMEALPSWQVGLVISTLLENAGFKVMPGWLEVFPNKRYASPDGQLSLFNGHRLPLQQGSYLLNGDFQAIASSHNSFVQRWELAAQQNVIDQNILEKILRTALRRNYRVSTKAAKFLNDLNCEIESGWTGYGQTNYLLGRIALRSYVFGHILYAASPLTGKALVEDIVRLAKQSPGFEDWCRHKHDLTSRAQEWARSVEANPRYYPYSHDTVPTLQHECGPGWHERQKLAARARITRSVEILINKDIWPEGITARYDALITFGISGSTLYKHRDLWHPKFAEQSIKNETALNHRMGVCLGGNAQASQAYCKKGDDSVIAECSDDTKYSKNSERCNAPARSAYGPPQQLKLDVLEAIAAARTAQEAQRKQALRQEHVRQPEQQAEFLAKIQAWAASMDPILAAEGQQLLKAMGRG